MRVQFQFEGYNINQNFLFSQFVIDVRKITDRYINSIDFPIDLISFFFFQNRNKTKQNKNLNNFQKIQLVFIYLIRFSNLRHIENFQNNEKNSEPHVR